MKTEIKKPSTVDRRPSTVRGRATTALSRRPLCLPSIAPWATEGHSRENGNPVLPSAALFIFFLSAFCLLPSAFSDSISLYEENDCFWDTDGWYSNGFQAQYENDDAWGLKLAQQIYTPENKDSFDPQYGDRPYAGYLHGSFYKNFLKGNQDDYLEITAGVIGPAALGEETQNGFHNVLGMHSANGWKYQLANEPTLNAAYYKSVSSRLAPWLEFKPLAGVNFGNVLADAEAGSFIRAGWNLPAEFSPTMYSFAGQCRRLKDQPFYFYIFAGAVGKAVAYDHFLDGSLFRNEQVTVRHKNFVADGFLGACAGIWRLELTFTHCERTEEWLSQPDRDNKFESIKLTYKF
jgi:lipid A 3-O-deacylase